MSKEFKLTVKKDSVKLNISSLNIKPTKLKKINLVIRGKNKFDQYFNAYVTIKFDNTSTKIKIKKINIKKLEIENLSDDNSYFDYKNIYNLDLDSSSSSSSENNVTQDVYDNLNLFVKSIVLSINNDVVNTITFTLKNTNIHKLKLKGKIH